MLDSDYHELFKDSLLFNFDVYDGLNKSLEEQEYEEIEVFHKIVYQKREDEIVRLKSRSLEDIFKEYDFLKERNSKILEAINDGYKQSEIAYYLGLTSAGVSYIVRNF